MQRAPENMARLQQLVLDDPALQATLRAIPASAVLVDAVVQLGAERGFPVAPDDVQEAMSAGRRAWIERWL